MRARDLIEALTLSAESTPLGLDTEVAVTLYHDDEERPEDMTFTLAVAPTTEITQDGTVVAAFVLVTGRPDRDPQSTRLKPWVPPDLSHE